ncbi:hypothetical protein B0A50_03771 [Salinomyces thailandicus]|uniref:SPRY domain-containing protein n=1 Tax=Salinomyces thailandicus TaxID=706561 RepID=A0A4U0U2N7_9PEZI|nr:hypothetical protein B0A50_03771 [Salinomyces thailandica]
MADPIAPPTGITPAPLHPLEQDHAPTVPSPLNPSTSRAPSKTPGPAPPPIQREQREKKDSLKKRESTATASGPNTALGKRKAHAAQAYPSPQRFNVPPPRPQDFEAPRADIMVSHEPLPFEVPMAEGEKPRQLYKPIDLAENKRGYRYQRAIADPLFPHKQFYRATSPPPHYSHLSFEDADRNMHFTTDALLTTNEKGWRMVRSNVCAREGTLYYEVKMRRAVPPDGPAEAVATGPQPHVRFGFARREAPLDAPVGFDGYSYGITDLRFEPMHRSRPSKFYYPKPKTKKGSSKPSTFAAPPPITLAPEDQDVKEGDVIGLEIQLPSLTLHRKITSGIYNPAVDLNDGFDRPPSPDPTSPPPDIIRDRIPVPYKGNSYFETLDHVPTKPMDLYADRQTNLAALPQTSGSAKDAIHLKAPPNPNHEHPSLRTLPHSAFRVYKNGKLIGTAFENLLAFLPPASAPAKGLGAREGVDDGLVGYYPAVSCFAGGVVECNFGDGGSVIKAAKEEKKGFWCPPPHLTPSVPLTSGADAARAENSAGTGGFNPGRRCRPMGERYAEQVAEDIVWDLVDEADFFAADGAFAGEGEGEGTTAAG